MILDPMRPQMISENFCPAIIHPFFEALCSSIEKVDPFNLSPGGKRIIVETVRPYLGEIGLRNLDDTRETLRLVRQL